MLQRVGELLGLGRRVKAAAEDDARLAAAALLIEAACADGRRTPEEVSVVERLVRERFDLDAGAVRALLDEGDSLVDRSVDLVRHTRELKRALGSEERIEVLIALWQVVLADGTLDRYEDTLVRQVAGLLHVTDSDRALARRRALGRLAEELH